MVFNKNYLIPNTNTNSIELYLLIMSLFRLIKKSFENQTFIENGYEYTFLKIEKDDKYGIYLIYANCKLPKPYQAYILKKINEDIFNIIEEFSLHVGEKINYSLFVTVNGEKAIDVFIPYEKLQIGRAHV